MDKSIELDEWYNQMMNESLTDAEKGRVQKEYDARKAKGKGKPFFWIPSAEESDAKMRKDSPSYNNMINTKAKQALKSAKTSAKVAEGVANGGAIVSALNGEKDLAKEFGGASKKLVKSQKELDKMRKGKTPILKDDKKVEVEEGEKKSNPTSSSTATTFAEVLKINDNDPKKVREWLGEHPEYKAGKLTNEWLEKNEVKEEKGEKPKKTFKDLEKATADAQDKEAYSDAQVIQNASDVMKKDEKDLEDMNKLAETFYKKSSNIDEFYKENLPKTLWRMYKDGDIDKKQLGYLILNGLGTGLANASLVARGIAPSQESDLQKIRRERLEGALDRYNKKRDETMSKTLELFGLNSELLNKFNIDTDVLKNNKIFDELVKSRDRKNIERTIRAYKVAGDYLTGLSEEQKKNVSMAIMAMNSKDAKDAAVLYLTTTLGDNAFGKIMNAFDGE